MDTDGKEVKESIIIGNITITFSNVPSENVKENIVDILSSVFEERVKQKN